MSTRLLPMGICAVLVDDPPGGPAAWARGLRALGVDGIIDIVPAAATVLVRCSDLVALQHVTGRIDEVVPTDGASSDAVVTISVRYDGADLADVAAASGLSVDEVIAMHSGADYRVAFCGFAPGFGYLVGLPERLHLPRRSSPRMRVPAGSVAIAAEYAAVYPRSSPGGWNVLGVTDTSLFDPQSDPPALLTPGTTVRFVVS